MAKGVLDAWIEGVAGAWPASKILASTGRFAGAAGFARKSGFTEDGACVTCRTLRTNMTMDGKEAEKCSENTIKYRYKLVWQLICYTNGNAFG